MADRSNGRTGAIVALVLAAPMATAAFAQETGGPAVADRTRPAALERADGDDGAQTEGAASTGERFDGRASIVEIYQRFVELSRQSGNRLTFEISNVATHGRSELDELMWLDLFTLPSGKVIETVPYELAGDLPSQSVVSYRSSWRELDPEQWSTRDFVKHNSLLRASTATDRLASWDPASFSDIFALSTFEVAVSFEGQRRDYRALVLWSARPGPGLRPTVVDHVVPAVGLTDREDREAMSLEELERRRRGPIGLPWRKMSCERGSSVHAGPRFTTPYDTTDHLSGFHAAELQVAYFCESYPSCRVTCEPSAIRQFCHEAGLTAFFIHRRFETVKISSIDGFHGADAQCGFAFGCAVKDCLLGVCGSVSWAVSGHGHTLTVTASTSVLDDMSISHGSFCSVEPSEGCSSLAAGVKVLDLEGAEAPFELPSTGVVLRRLEDSGVVHRGEPVRYLMGEWALLSYATGGGGESSSVRSLRSSSPAFAETQVEALTTALATGMVTKAVGAGERTALVVALPPHEANSRLIPMPRLRLTDPPMPEGLPEGRVLVRADFAEDHELQALTVLHDTVGGVDRQLALYLESALSLERASEGDHRVVVFALLDVAGGVEVEATLAYLPKCCCGDEHCV